MITGRGWGTIFHTAKETWSYGDQKFHWKTWNSIFLKTEPIFFTEIEAFDVNKPIKQQKKKADFWDLTTNCSLTEPQGDKFFPFSPDLLHLGKERPQTDTAVARRLVSHALGWRHRQQEPAGTEVFQTESLDQEE